jgi:hypothetical protein
MSQVHQFTTQSEMTTEQRNADALDAARSSASSAKREAGDLPAAIDSNRPRPFVDHKPPIWTAAAYTPTPSLNEAVIKAVEGFEDFPDDPAMASAVSAFSAATVSLAKIAAAKEPLSKDTSKTSEQKLLLMAGHADKALDKMTTALDRAHKNLTNLADDLDAQLSKPLEQSTGNALSVEIRAYVRGLPKDKRDAFVNDAVKRGDMQVMQSVLGAPSFLSEISDERKAMWLRDYHEKADPKAVARLSMYRKTIEILMQRPANLLVNEMEKAMGGTFKDVRRLRGQVTASDNALAGLGE